MLVGACDGGAVEADQGSALYEMVPGVIAASIAIVVASLLSRAPGDAVRAPPQAGAASLREQGY